MTTPTAPSPAESTALICISPIEDDHTSLKRIFSRSTMQPKWAIEPMLTLELALPVMRATQVPVVLSECELLPGTWRDVLELVVMLPAPPLLVVMSSLADDRLWAEALNLGAFDVLTKPFDADEVNRTLEMAWRHWKDRKAQSKNLEMRHSRL